MSKSVVIVFEDDAEAEGFYAALTARDALGNRRHMVAYDDQLGTERGSSYPEEWPGVYSVSSAEIAAC